MSDFFIHWLLVVVSRLWNARKSFGVRCFILIWLIVLATPFLRSVLIAQSAHNDTLLYPSPPWGNTREDSSVPSPFSETELFKKFPRDRDVQLAYAENVQYQNSLRRYDTFLKSRANDAVFIAGRLRATMAAFHDDRVAGTLEYVARSPGSPAFGAPAFSSNPIKPPTPKELSTAIALARRGQTLEPNNLFYDWALLYFLLCARRDDEALRVLDIGSRKTHFDDHLLDNIAATIGAQEKVRPLLVEEKIGAIYSALLPHLAKMRHTARLISWLAWQKAQRGDVQSEIKIRSDLARLSRHSLNGRQVLITSLVARTSILLAWNYDLTYIGKGTLPPLRKKPSPLRNLNKVQIANARAASFSAHCVQNGRPDLAQETRLAMSDIKRSEGVRLKLETLNDGMGFYFPRVLIYDWFGFACLAQPLLLLAAYGFVSLLLLGVKTPEPARAEVGKIAFIVGECIVAAFLIGLSVNTPPEISDVWSMARISSSTLRVCGAWRFSHWRRFFAARSFALCWVYGAIRKSHLFFRPLNKFCAKPFC